MSYLLIALAGALVAGIAARKRRTVSPDADAPVAILPPQWAPAFGVELVCIVCRRRISRDQAVATADGLFCTTCRSGESTA